MKCLCFIESISMFRVSLIGENGTKNSSKHQKLILCSREPRRVKWEKTHISSDIFIFRGNQ